MKIQNSTFEKETIQKIYKIHGKNLSDGEVPRITKLSLQKRGLVELVKEQIDLKERGYGLYMISINYNQYSREHTYDEVSAYFDRFYHQKLVPLLVGNHATRKNKRHLWPVVTLTTEENTAHRKGKIHDHKVKNGTNSPVFHHHAAVAIHPSLIDKFDKFLGLNQIPRISSMNMIESIDIRKANEDGILYCTKTYSEQIFSKKYGPILIDEELTPTKQPKSITELLANSTLQIHGVTQLWIDPDDLKTVKVMEVL